ncbi:MAG: hypothetical protein EXS31_09345 [Pedosphaera sp.]|nr:hypothetical protein [Pedosphaera sp.]
MPINCPACGKKNETADACSRCSSDLTRLRAVRLAAAAHLAKAYARLTERTWAAALSHAGRSWELLHTPQSARLACLAAAALGDAGGVKQWRRREAG